MCIHCLGFDLTPEVSANKVLKYQESMMKVNSPTPSRCVQQRQLPSPKLAGGLTGADIDLSEEKKPSNSKVSVRTYGHISSDKVRRSQWMISNTCVSLNVLSLPLYC